MPLNCSLMYNLDKIALRVYACDGHSGRLHSLSVLIVKLISVAVTLCDFLCSVSLLCFTPGDQLAVIAL